MAVTANNVATFPYEMPATAEPVTKTLTIDCTASGIHKSQKTLFKFIIYILGSRRLLFLNLRKHNYSYVN